MYEKHLSNTLKLDIFLVLKQRNNSFSLLKTNKHVEQKIEIINENSLKDLTFKQHKENFEITFFFFSKIIDWPLVKQPKPKLSSVCV